MKIEQITAITDEVFEQINTLMTALSASYQPDRATLNLLASSENSKLYILRKDKQIIGCYTLGYYVSPTGRKACLEDVVVHPDFRGQGLGKTLITHAINELKNSGVKQVLFTSKPSRIAANTLYKSLGFTQKETNVYVMKFSS